MVDQPPPSPIPYRKVFEALSAMVGILALPYAVSLPLRDFKLVDNQYSAGLMFLVAIVASLLLLSAVEAFQRWIAVPGLSSNGGRGYVAMALLAVVFTAYGFMGHVLIGQTDQVVRKKPTVIQFEPQTSSAELMTPELIPYRDSLMSVTEKDKFEYPMVTTVPYVQPTAAHFFTVGPGNAIDTGLAFLIPGYGTEGIRILKVVREKGKDSGLAVVVPEAEAGDRVLLLLRTTGNADVYPGVVK